MNPIRWGKLLADSSIRYALVVRVAGDSRRATRWIAVLLLSFLSTAGQAQETAAQQEFDFDIPRQRADVSLPQFAEQADQPKAKEKAARERL